MSNTNQPVVQIPGKDMHLYVFEDRVELFKAISNKVFSFQYNLINKVLFRPTSSSQTGFIKVRAQSGMFDFVTYKFRRETIDEINNMINLLTAAKNEIDARVKAAKGMPENSTVVIYY